MVFFLLIVESPEILTNYRGFGDCHKFYINASCNSPFPQQYIKMCTELILSTVVYCIVIFQLNFPAKLKSNKRGEKLYPFKCPLSFMNIKQKPTAGSCYPFYIFQISWPTLTNIFWKREFNIILTFTFREGYK